MIKKQVGYVFFIMFLCITLFMFLNSMRDAGTSTQQSSVFVSLTQSIIQACGKKADTDIITYVVRKTAHFMEFAAQAGALGLFIICCSKSFFDRIVYILFIGLLSACTDEFIQLFSVGRSSRVSDVFIDFSGTVTAVVICIFIYKFLKKRT